MSHILLEISQPSSLEGIHQARELSSSPGTVSESTTMVEEGWEPAMLVRDRSPAASSVVVKWRVEAASRDASVCARWPHQNKLLGSSVRSYL